MCLHVLLFFPISRSPPFRTCLLSLDSILHLSHALLLTTGYQPVL